MVLPDNERSEVQHSTEEIKGEAKQAIDFILKALDQVSLIGSHVESSNCISAVVTLENAQRNLRQANKSLDDAYDRILAHGQAFNIEMVSKRH